MRLMPLFVVWLFLASPATAQETRITYVRFFNDSAKAANFYIDSRFGCSIPANPEENNAYCDAEVAVGKHSVNLKGDKLRSQSCELYVTDRGPAGAGAEAHLSKSERLNCISFITAD